MICNKIFKNLIMNVFCFSDELPLFVPALFQPVTNAETQQQHNRQKNWFVVKYPQESNQLREIATRSKTFAFCIWGV